MPQCLREECGNETAYGSPACLEHWQEWRDEEENRVAAEWGLDAVASEYEEEQRWLKQRRGH
jgi:predicted adenine nucleotide alpha hydrolase (AANH) superfamily ATPase